VTDDLVTISFCRLGVSRELHIDQGRKFDSRLLLEELQRLGITKTRITPQSDILVEKYEKTVEEQLRKVVSIQQRD
jgi:hypothetical protein